ncbi:MAG: CsbD family protein [Anaerolineaceae bacterium]
MDNKLKGKVNQAAGTTRQKAGGAVGNDELEQKGRAQHLKGDAQEAIADAQDKVSDASDKVKDAVSASADKAKHAAKR